MQRSDVARTGRILVSMGELKVSCGRDVVFETPPLRDEYAIAVFDPVAVVGGVLVTARELRKGADPPATLDTPALDPLLALPVLVDSILRLGGRRDRLIHATAGGPAPASSGWPLPHAADPAVCVRRDHVVMPVVLTLDLGAGLVFVGSQSA